MARAPEFHCTRPRTLKPIKDTCKFCILMADSGANVAPDLIRAFLKKLAPNSVANLVLISDTHTH